MISRNEFVDKLKAQIDEGNIQIDKLQAKITQAGTDAKTVYDDQLNDLKKKQEELAQKFQQIKGSSEEAWENIKEAVTIASDTLKKNIEEAWLKFK